MSNENAVSRFFRRLFGSRKPSVADSEDSRDNPVVNTYTGREIFSIYDFADLKSLEVIVYKSLDDFTRMIEWQDALGDEFTTVIDTTGNVYKWDDTKTDEYATSYGYTMIPYRVDTDLSERCMLHYERSGYADEFHISYG